MAWKGLFLFKESIRTGYLPYQWKEANIVALFKKGDRRKVCNYRPISLTCIICKILESIIRDQVLEFLIVHSKITEHQFGFVSGKSCSLQLLYCVHKWIDEIESNHSVAVFYTDF